MRKLLREKRHGGELKNLDRAVRVLFCATSGTRGGEGERESING